MVGSPFVTLDNLMDNISTEKIQNQTNLCIKCVEAVDDSVLIKSPNYNILSIATSFLSKWLLTGYPF